jgi:hypothetical protein
MQNEFNGPVTGQSNFHRRAPRLAAFALAASLAGCGGRPAAMPNTPVSLDEVPNEVLAAAKKEFPDSKVTTACKNPAGDFELYSQNKRGKIHLLIINPSGEVLESE